jgi:hypothetical protein
MQRSAWFLVALFVVAVSASVAIKFWFSAERPGDPDRSVQADRGDQVGAGEATAGSPSAAQGRQDVPRPIDTASATPATDLSARPQSGNAMHRGDLEIRATSEASLIARFEAVQELGDVASSSAVQTLSTVLLTDQAVRVRLAAVQSLVDIAKDSPGLAAEVRAALQAVADDSNNNVSVASRQALAAIQ